jgi:hypothetical protein
MSALRQRRTRFKQRGAAALEFALSTIFLVPLILGTLDFGYYFWVSVNIAEAAKEVGMAASRAAPGLTDCGNIAQAPLIAAGVAAGTLRKTAYMAAAGSGLPSPVVPTITCANVPPGSFSTVLEVNFPLPVGMVRAMLPAGTPSPNVRYRTPAFISP